MKKLYSLLVLLILFAGINSAYSQELQKFKAKAGLSVAEGQAKTDGTDDDGNEIPGMTNPKLVAIATMTGDIEDVPYTLAFDLESGEASIWLYIFTDADNPDMTRAVAVMKIFIMIPIDFPLDQGPELPFGNGEYIDTEKWDIDSDDLVDQLVLDSEYKSYFESYPDAGLQMLLLSINADQPILELGHIFWAAIFNDAENPDAPMLTCVVDAETGETICLSASSVSDDIGESVMVYPNPASDKAIISLPNELLEHNPEITIYNSRGEFVRLINVPGGITTNLVMFNVSDLSSGVYFVQYSGSTFRFMKKMIINK